MNRFVPKFAALALAVFVLAGILAGPSAHATDRLKKKKKQTDLSANPLAAVDSKQPDKELFDKAMVAMKKGRLTLRGSICRPCSTPIRSRSSGCAPSWPWATAGSKREEPRP